MKEENKKWVVVSGHSSFESGGVGTHLRILIQELRKSSIDFEIVLGKGRVQAVLLKIFATLARMFLLESQEAIIFFHVSLLSGRIRKALRRAAGCNVVVHCHDFYSVLAAIKLLNLGYSFRIVYTVHAPFTEQFHLSDARNNFIAALALRIEQEFVPKCDGFIFVDDLQKQIIESKIGKLPEARYTVLPNAVNLEAIETFRLRAQRKPYIVVARHLYEKCGVHVAIEAFSKVDMPDDIKLVIVGDGDQKEILEKQASDLGVSSRVVFLGKKHYHVCLSIISEAMLSIVPSIPVGNYIEATSLTMLESLALGVPLIASDIGGLHQVLAGTDAGVLVPAGDVDQLAGAIARVISNPGYAWSLGEKGRNLVERNYSSTSWFSRQVAFLF